MKRNILRVAAISLLVIGLPTATNLLANDKPPTAREQSLLSKKLLGTWILVGAPGEVGEAPAAGARLKFLTGKNWNITQADPETGVTIFHHGGTYTLNGDQYVETLQYANENTKHFINKTYKFTIKIEGDTMTQIGIGNPIQEVWKRAK